VAADDTPIISDTLVFHPFTSVVIAFGGNNNVPLDTGDGAFDIARTLYARGYDVHAYNEGVVDEGNFDPNDATPPPPPYAEVESAVEERGVTEVAILGYSYGGGATYVLADQLEDHAPTGTFALAFTAYIDAVDHDSPGESEERLPPETDYHVNYYETIDFPLDGEATDTDPNNPNAVIINVNVNNTTWGANLDHYTIDDDEDHVQARIIDGYDDTTDPQHSGLTDLIAPF
jgi:hypothetical protein